MVEAQSPSASRLAKPQSEKSGILALKAAKPRSDSLRSPRPSAPWQAAQFSVKRGLPSSDCFSGSEAAAIARDGKSARPNNAAMADNSFEERGTFPPANDDENTDSAIACVDARTGALLTRLRWLEFLHMQVIRKYGTTLIICGALVVAGSVAIVHAQGTLASGEKPAEVPRMPSNHFLFATSAHCISCHSQVHAPSGEDISIGIQWRASVMANSARDPYWQAAIRRETMDHPGASAAIEDKCSTCHMPMQRYQARAEGLRGQVLKYLGQISSGAALDEPEGELEDVPDIKATLAADGVS